MSAQSSRVSCVLLHQVRQAPGHLKEHSRPNGELLPSLEHAAMEGDALTSRSYIARRLFPIDLSQVIRK